MPNKSKAVPLMIIILAVALAGGLALYLSRQGTAAEATDQNTAQTILQSGGGGRIRGAAEAPITVVEYGDFQCPTCRHYHPILMELLSRYQGKVKLEYHHYPLISIHPNAMGAAMAAESAADQGKYWEMHDMLYERQQEWSPHPNAEAMFLQFALQLGLDGNRFMQSMRSPETRDRILADVTRGNSIVKEGTPTFLINGQPVGGLPDLQGFQEKIDTHLAALVK